MNLFRGGCSLCLWRLKKKYRLTLLLLINPFISHLCSISITFFFAFRDQMGPNKKQGLNKVSRKLKKK